MREMDNSYNALDYLLVEVVPGGFVRFLVQGLHKDEIVRLGGPSRLLFSTQLCSTSTCCWVSVGWCVWRCDVWCVMTSLVVSFQWVRFFRLFRKTGPTPMALGVANAPGGTFHNQSTARLSNLEGMLLILLFQQVFFIFVFVVGGGEEVKWRSRKGTSLTPKYSSFQASFSSYFGEVNPQGECKQWF